MEGCFAIYEDKTIDGNLDRRFVDGTFTSLDAAFDAAVLLRPTFHEGYMPVIINLKDFTCYAAYFDDDVSVSYIGNMVFEGE